jgi:heme/copper-type cytochrome/quinol oxidase subunit 4
MSIEHTSNDLCILSAAILVRSIISFMQYGFFSFLGIMYTLIISAPILISNSVLVDSTVLNVCIAILILLMVTWFVYLVYRNKNKTYYLDLHSAQGTFLKKYDGKFAAYILCTLQPVATTMTTAASSPKTKIYMSLLALIVNILIVNAFDLFYWLYYDQPAANRYGIDVNVCKISIHGGKAIIYCIDHNACEYIYAEFNY